MHVLREKLPGRWRNAAQKTEFVLHDDGSAETTLGDTERYPGKWYFLPPNQLLVRAVIPYNDPEIDDELNAHEMCFAIRNFTVDGFTAEEFDCEGLREFTRVSR